MIDLFLTIIFYMALAATGFLLVVFFIALMQAYDLTQAEKVAIKPVKVDIPEAEIEQKEDTQPTETKPAEDDCGY